MNILNRIKGLIFSPRREWEVIEAEAASIPELYRSYILVLAAIPPFASFIGAYLFGFPRGPHDIVQIALLGGLWRAFLQYVLSLPLLYVVAFVISSAAPQFDGKSDDTKALTLVAYSFTPAWLAALAGVLPAFRWLDILGFYGIYVFYHGVSRMMKSPKDHTDIITLAVLVLAVAASSLHALIIHTLVPLETIAR